jgi:hypothetical protein
MRFFGNPEAKKPYITDMQRWEGNINMDLK